MATQRNHVVLSDAVELFSDIWKSLETQYGKTGLNFPKEIMWLGGAPGSGKGTNTPFIMRERSLTAPPIVISNLLQGPEAVALKNRGMLVSDREVITLLLKELLKEEYESGVVVDGFPRTQIQVECVRMLFQKMQEMRAAFFNTPQGPSFPSPIFRITILYVHEEISIERQLKRGMEIKKYNEEVERKGRGDKVELRPTDLDPEMARKRYRVFMEHTFEALNSLRDLFHYHFIDANGSIASVENKIKEGFKYESSLELGQATYDSLRGIPIVGNLTLHTRQELVRRLDDYRDRHAELLNTVISIIEKRFVPVLKRQAAVGRAKIRSNDLELNKELAIDMLIDILVERGFSPTAELKEEHVPLRIDPDTHAVINATTKSWLFEIHFQTNHIRRGQ